MASYPDSVYDAASFGIGHKGYIIGGNNRTTAITICYAYSPYTNLWSPIASIPRVISSTSTPLSGVATSVNSKGYCFNASVDSIYKYDPIADSWSNLGGFTAGLSASSFVINNKVYICYPTAFTNHAGMRVYDVIAGSWSRINVFPYPTGCTPFNPYIGLSIGNKGFLGAQNFCTGNSYWQYDTAYHFDITSVTHDTICQSDSFSVTISSNLSFSGSNSFKVVLSGNPYGGPNISSDSVLASTTGTYTFRLPSSTFLPTNFNSTNISVFSSNPPYQTGYDSVLFLVKRNPSYIPLAPSFGSCGGSTLLLYRANVTGQTYQWTSSPPGVSDTTYVLSFTPTAPTTKIYTTDINTATGCAMYDSTIVYLHSPPASNISDSSYGICPGSSVTLGSTPIPYCSYKWTGGGISLNTVDVTLSPSASTVYHVLAKDTTTLCSVGVNISVTVKQPPAQTICYVTVDTASTHNIVIWEKLDKYATDSFIVYRETSTNVYTEIAAFPRDSLSEYHDYGANPNVTAYRYKIATLDTCGNYGALSPYHNTIHVQYLGFGNLNWNVYAIEYDTVTPVSSFDVYWDTLANGNWQVMLNVSGNQYTATDINYSMHPNARYRIVANWSFSCTPSRGANNEVLSNVISIKPGGINTLAPRQSVSVYPNPAINELMISCGTAQVEQVSILSADGKLISANMHPVHNRLDISQLEPGIYIAEIKVNNEIQRIKWVKM